MTTDLRTESERRYDETRLSRTPIADQGPFGTDVTDEMIALLEQIEAAHPKATAEQILARTQPAQPERSPLYYELIAWIDAHFANEDTDAEADTLTADEETVLNIILKQQPDKPADTLLLTFPDGARFTGTFEEDGSHSCAHLVHANGQFYCDASGVFSGDWAGHYFEELTLEQALSLQELFNDGLLIALLDVAKDWCKA